MQSEDCRALKLSTRGKSCGTNFTRLTFCESNVSRSKFPWCENFQLLHESEPLHILFHLKEIKKAPLFSVRFPWHIHFPSYCFIFILVICALNWSGHKSRCPIKFTHAAILLSQRRSSDARAHPVDKALPREWIWWLQLFDKLWVGCACVGGLMWYPENRIWILDCYLPRGWERLE